ncbi:MAG: hypothetical protein SFU98_00535 [Leptospiraceae bacterium]|nr:hypothetical protein [Leptospiraceae bacterium]
MFYLLISLVLTALVHLNAQSMDSYKEVTDKFFNEQIQKLDKGTLQEKVTAIDKLKKMKTRRALRPLIMTLRGVSSNESTPAKSQKQIIDDSNEVTTINLDISDNNAPVIKFWAARALADIGHEKAMKPMVEVYTALEKTIQDKDKPHYRDELEMKNIHAAAELLRMIGDLIENLYEREEASSDKIKPASDAIKLGIETLKNSLFSHKHYYIRSAAADGLKNSRRKDALSLLNTATTSEKNEYVRAAILGGIIIIHPSNSEKFFELVELLKSDDPAVRIRSSQGLGESGIGISEVYLRQTLQYEENTAVRDQIKNDIAVISNYRVPSAPTDALYSEIGNKVNSPSQPSDRAGSKQ